MNERIDELMIQAGYHLYADWDGMIHFDPKKFAELIVRECISKAEDYGLGVDAVEQMKEDFGVDE